MERGQTSLGGGRTQPQALSLLCSAASCTALGARAPARPQIDVNSKNEERGACGHRALIPGGEGSQVDLLCPHPQQQHPFF